MPSCTQNNCHAVVHEKKQLFMMICSRIVQKGLKTNIGIKSAGVTISSDLGIGIRREVLKT